MAAFVIVQYNGVMNEPHSAPQHNSPYDQQSYDQQSGQTPYDQPTSPTTPTANVNPNAESYGPTPTYGAYTPQAAPEYGQQGQAGDPNAQASQTYGQPGQAGQPGQPGGYGANPYAQPYGYPPQGPGYYAPMPPAYARWNVLCIVGFVLAFVLPPVGLVISIISLVQINKSGEKSKGLAIAGIVLNAIFTLLLIAVIAFAFWVIGEVATHYGDSGSYPEWCEYGLDNGMECRGYNDSDYSDYSDTPDYGDIDLDEVQRLLEQYSRTGDIA
ncbi:peptidyl-prolyl cis-trans isomerase [Bifidobacterium sp. DSM 109957]|uniref:Peptidyl-prolyl cis-trans isomerase n=2 Tax=Bifidobacterium oedipodis TaxID=2675322 RepID=A0A7Y0EPV6_9BIFI|nr:peptidyl-prolyl cis-trans isomerase [Bifidobacterium sp. DSM 109957]